MTVCAYSEFDPITLKPLNQHTAMRLQEVRLQQFDFRARSVLDIGCHLGLLSFTAARNGAASVLGVDVTPEFIAGANENLEKFAAHNEEGSRLRFEIAGFDKLDPAIHRSDLVLCFEVLHWLTLQGIPISSSIQKLRQLTKSDLVFEFPWDITESSIAVREQLTEDDYNPELIFRELTKYFSFVRVMGFMDYMQSTDAKRVLVHAR